MYLYEYDSHIESIIQMDFIANVCSGTGVCGFSQILGVKHCFICDSLYAIITTVMKWSCEIIRK